MSVTSPHADDQPALTPQARELLTIARQEGWAGAERSLQLVDPDTREALIRGGWALETARGRLLWTEEARGMEVPAEGRAGVRRYRRRPVEVEAFEVTEDNVEQVAEWMADHGIDLVATLAGDHQRISWAGQGHTRPGTATPGDIVVLADGGFSVETEPSRFHRDYEPA